MHRLQRSNSNCSERRPHLQPNPVPKGL